MILLRAFHEKTFAAILSEDDKDYLWISPYDDKDLFSVDDLNISNQLVEFPDWATAQKYLVGARMVAASKLVSRIECKPDSAASKGLTLSETKRMLVQHVIGTLLPKRGFEEALQFVNATCAFHELDDEEKIELEEAMSDQPEECKLRLGYILKSKDFDSEFRISQALLHINEVLIPEGRGDEAKGVIFHILNRGYAKDPVLVKEAERLYGAAKRVNAIARREQIESQPDYKRGVSMSPKIKIL